MLLFRTLASFLVTWWSLSAGTADAVDGDAGDVEDDDSSEDAELIYDGRLVSEWVKLSCLSDISVPCKYSDSCFRQHSASFSMQASHKNSHYCSFLAKPPYLLLSFPVLPESAKLHCVKCTKRAPTLRSTALTDTNDENTHSNGCRCPTRLLKALFHALQTLFARRLSPGVRSWSLLEMARSSSRQLSLGCDRWCMLTRSSWSTRIILASP